MYSSDVLNAGLMNPYQSTASAVESLLETIGSESIADAFDIGRHSSTYDFDFHVKIAMLERIDPSSS
ncbi:MAG: hypothetical protein ACOCYZ_06475 [Halococcoides sp.]